LQTRGGGDITRRAANRKVSPEIPFRSRIELARAARSKAMRLHQFAHALLARPNATTSDTQAMRDLNPNLL
jgi:hypothetical protein